MAILLKVKWIDKSEESDAFQCIRCIGGITGDIDWKHTQAQAIRSIEEGAFAYYVETGHGASVLQVGLSPDGRKYLKAGADATHPGILTSLPGFPVPTNGHV